MQSDRCLICRYAQKKAFGFLREACPVRTQDDHADFTMYAQLRGDDRNAFDCQLVPYLRERPLSVGSQWVAEHIADFLGRQVDFAVLGDSENLHWHHAKCVAQPRVSEIQAEHTEEYIQKSLNNLRWFTAAPDSRQSEQAR